MSRLVYSIGVVPRTELPPLDLISFSPNTPLCLGEQVEMICYVQAPVSDNFALSVAAVSINGSEPQPLGQLNTNSLVNGIDLGRYSANTNGLTLSQSRPAISLIIGSYLPIDSYTTFQCYGTFANGTLLAATLSDMPMRQAG